MDKLRREMAKVAEGLPTKSEKIRQLGARGYTRQQIADFLGIRYQHVRNVLIDAEKKRAQENAPSGVAEETTRPFQVEEGRVAKLDVVPDGSLSIPKEVLAAAGFSPGDRVILMIAREGYVELLSRMEGRKRAQEMFRQFVPEGIGLVDEFLGEKRREAEKEEREIEEYTRR